VKAPEAENHVSPVTVSPFFAGLRTPTCRRQFSARIYDWHL